MTKNERAWWSPEALAQREREVRTAGAAGETDVRNDFASYKALAQSGNTDTSGLYMHNEVEPWRIDTVCGDYATLIRRFRDHAPKTIADLGCGAGFTTDGLHRVWPSATVTGFDVSVDAVQFARTQWQQCQFVDGAVVPDKTMVGAPFDVLLCQEFYPFTRTGDASAHRQWLRCLLNNMSNDGLAIIMVAASTHDSINDTYTELRREFTLRRVRVAAPRISRRLPFAMSRVVAMLLRDVRPVWVRNLYVLQR
ncbi:MAG: methyltransferase domain-containing protein [Betaproteobacteria bacterium]|nr:methyltransferase domain-containing protein [Betaproteobacteria bacterium]